MGYNDFHADLKKAVVIEERVIVHMLQVNPKMVFHGFTGTKGYDAHFSVDNKYYKLEVKSDYYTADTGNIVIEFTSRGKDSGIATTQANLWAYAVITPKGLDIYLLPTSTIKRIIKEELYHNVMTAGDPGSNTKMYVFKLDLVAKYAKKLEENNGNR